MDRKPKTVFQLDSPFTMAGWFVPSSPLFYRVPR
jgi:hypothetical protein